MMYDMRMQITPQEVASIVAAVVALASAATAYLKARTAERHAKDASASSVSAGAAFTLTSRRLDKEEGK
jgi:hypothetical protein